MNVSTSNDLTTTAISLYQAQSNPSWPPGAGDAELSSRVAPLDALDNSFSDKAKDALYAKAKEMKNSGASDDDIKSFVNTELATNGDDESADSQRTGRLIDILA